jgi:acid phosphatase
MWDREHEAKPVPGVVEFVLAAHEAGVTTYPDEEDVCPQKQTVIDGIRELGIAVEPEFVSLALERPEWKGEKLIRRQLIAEDYRIIMLIGDDFSDFVPCARKSVYAPCTQGATRASRAADVRKYANYWGNGWYILPGPMHGSWTSVR